MKNNERLLELGLFYSELLLPPPSTEPWCNMLQTSLWRKKYEEEMLDEQPRDDRFRPRRHRT